MSDALHTQLCRKSLLKQLNTSETGKDPGEKGGGNESWERKAKGEKKEVGTAA